MRQAYQVCGQPWTSSSGGPSPPVTACRRSSPVSTYWLVNVSVNPAGRFGAPETEPGPVGLGVVCLGAMLIAVIGSSSLVWLTVGKGCAEARSATVRLAAIPRAPAVNTPRRLTLAVYLLSMLACVLSIVNLQLSERYRADVHASTCMRVAQGSAHYTDDGRGPCLPLLASEWFHPVVPPSRPRSSARILCPLGAGTVSCHVCCVCCGQESSIRTAVP